MSNDNDSAGSHLGDPRIPALDGVRGIAILGVLLCHGVNSIPVATEGMKIIKAIASFGTFGVDLFFVLSGYLITKILLRNHGASNLLHVFWARRIARIAPLYLLFLALMYSCCLLFFPENLPSPPWWSYVLYLQNFYLAQGCPISSFGFDITWSLVIEEHFYLIFPFCIALAPRKYHLPLILIFCSIGLPSRLFFHPWLEDHYSLVRLDSLFLTGRIDELGLGALLSFYDTQKFSMHKWWISPYTCLLLWACVGVMYIFKYNNHLVTGLAGFLTIGCTISNHWPKFQKYFEIRFLRFFGRISYALYLFHTPFFWLVKNNTAGISSFGFFFIAVGIAITLACLSTFYFEEPIQRKVKNLKYHSA